jgi:hypothetical protein
VYHKTKASDVIAWILKGETLDQRQRRIQHFLENEGYSLPEPPKGVDRSEKGHVHFVRGRRMTVEYAVIDQNGRKVYLYREIMVGHIMLQRIVRGEEWVLEHISLIPQILRSGQAVSEEPDKVMYHSKRRYRFPDGEQCFLRVIIKRGQRDQWYVATFYPRYRRR